MKSTRTGLGVRLAVLLCSTAIVCSTARAQDTAPPPPPQDQTQGPPPGGRGRGGPGGNPERRLEMLQKRLNLSADQTAQIKAILADGRAKMEALRSGDSGAPSADRRAEGMALMKEENGKIEAVLTPDQKSRYEEMMARQRERMQGRGPGGGDGGAPPPPPPPPPQQ